MDIVTSSASDFGKPNVEIKSFPDGDSYVRLLNRIAGESARIFTRLHPNQNTKLMETMFIAKTLSGSNIKDIELYTPYLPYARQDKLWKQGESLSARYILELLHSSGVTKITTLDCHFIKKTGIFEYWGIKITNKSAADFIIEEAKKHLDNPLIMSPDAGASYMSHRFGGGHMNKVRGEYEKGGTAYRKIKSLKMEENTNVSGRNVLLVDDIIGSGGTMLRAIDVLKRAGVDKIGIASTHGFFLNGALEKLKKVSDVIVTTNSVPNETSKVDAFKILSNGM